jgi:hypothetical protein
VVTAALAKTTAKAASDGSGTTVSVSSALGAIAALHKN